VVLNSVAITNMPLAWDLGAEDRWEGYPAQRDELLEFIYDNELRNVWFLTGDFHIGFVGRVEPRGPGNNLYEIALGPGGNGPNPLGVGLSLLDQFEFHTVDPEVATYLTFDPLEDVVRVVFTDKDGEVLYDESLSQ
jgi:alkaline phosphatase D